MKPSHVFKAMCLCNFLLLLLFERGSAARSLSPPPPFHFPLGKRGASAVLRRQRAKNGPAPLCRRGPPLPPLCAAGDLRSRPAPALVCSVSRACCEQTRAGVVLGRALISTRGKAAMCKRCASTCPDRKLPAGAPRRPARPDVCATGCSFSASCAPPRPWLSPLLALPLALTPGCCTA